MNKMYRIISSLSMMLLALLCVNCGGMMATKESQTPEIRKPSYLVLETYSGRILYSYNPNELRPIGMLTNVATATVVLDWMNDKEVGLDKVLVVPPAACQWASTNLMNLRPGDRITLRDALHSALMWDDSACAITLAYACGSTINPQDPEGAFIWQMNQMARTIGMRSTWFKGSSGSVISQSDTHDIARLSLYAMQHPYLHAICTKRSYEATVNGTRKVTIKNSNSMLANKSVDGLRAAKSSAAGACLIAIASRNSVKLPNPRTGKVDTYPQRLLIVVLGAHTSQSRYKIAQMMLKDAWGAWEEWQRSADFSNPYKFITLPR